MKTALMLIDWQERLFPVMPEGIRERNLKQVSTLHWFAKETGMPTFVSEQYPKGLGATLSSLEVTGAISKTHFSAMKEEVFANKVKENLPETVILTGMETHICVLQTGLDLLALGCRVQVVVDGVLSRRELDWKTGLAQLEKAGADLVTTEGVLFAHLEKAGGSLFKGVSRRIR
tara:strand:- start:162 stop:683 length:522 start_codon:yes stop_codon:yes gene_type:complete